ncbi:MAG: inositol monophosphatase [Gammaproteobacteria bacterium]|nr:inositol monophosphatase [Gammaproteobacteria bacterium]
MFFFCCLLKIMEPFVNVAVQIARQAGDYIRRQQDQAPFLEIKTNASNGEYTLVDIQAENLIIQAIRKKFPKHNILSEEQGSIHQDSEITWIIDPLDGTKNFLHGIGHYAISIAIQIKNQIEHAVVYDPLRNECFCASRGRGAQVNNRRMRVSPKIVLPQALIGYGKHVSVEHAETSVKTFIQHGIQHPSLRRMGCASLDLAYVAAGRYDAYFGYDLQPWDSAAGMLLIQEAGGVVCDFQGQNQSLPSKQIVAGNIKLTKIIVDTWKNN